jgi:hypothetical protein
MIRKVFMAILLAVPLVSCGDESTVAVPAPAVSAFYDIVVSERQGGVPDMDMRARLRPVISPELDSLLAQAAEAERRHTMRTNNSEPPYLQGDIFSSLFEGATAYEVGACATENAETVACAVSLSYEGEGETAKWQDRVLLTISAHDASLFLVDDIAYGGEWDFASRGTLKGSLRAVIAEEE